MRIINSLALENEETLENVEPVIPTEPEVAALQEQQEEVTTLGTDETETEMLTANADEQNDFNEEEKISLAIESLSAYAAITSDLIASRRCSMESLNLIRVGVAPHLAALNEKPLSIATESDKSIEELHQMALEGFWNNVAQDWVLRWKHYINATTDFFKNKEKQVEKYTSVLNNAEAEWKTKLPNLQRNQQDVSLDQLWYYFRKSSGQVTNPALELKQEEELSTYVLTKYTNDILSEFDKLASILSSAKFDSAENVVALAKKVESLKSPVEMFDKKFITGKQFMNVTQLVIEQGSRRSVINVNDTSLEALAKLATAGCISTSGSIGHNVLKVGANVHNAGATAAFVLSKNLIVDNNDVINMLKSGGKMLDNSKAYFDSGSKFTSISQKFANALSKIDSSKAYEDQSVVNILNQINQIAKNYTNAFKRTGVEVAAHSIKGAKYTGYLVNRIIWNAK